MKKYVEQLDKEPVRTLKKKLALARAEWKELQDETEKIYQRVSSLYAELRKRGVENP
jgi:hypothetical protein